MNPWALIGISLIVLYGVFLLLAQVFFLIDVMHQRSRLSAAEDRRGGPKQAEGMGGS